MSSLRRYEITEHILRVNSNQVSNKSNISNGIKTGILFNANCQTLFSFIFDHVGSTHLPIT